MRECCPPEKLLAIRYLPLAVFPTSRFADDLRLRHDFGESVYKVFFCKRGVERNGLQRFRAENC
ncbi:hypothetical protein [Fervidibacter sacchari]